VKRWLSKPVIAANQGTLKANEEGIFLLIVFDNVNDPDMLYDFWLSTGIGSVIVTSRNPLSMNGVYSPTVGFNLSTYDPGEAEPFRHYLRENSNPTA
jgi:hypothetical protein